MKFLNGTQVFSFIAMKYNIFITIFHKSGLGVQIDPSKPVMEVKSPRLGWLVPKSPPPLTCGGDQRVNLPAAATRKEKQAVVVEERRTKPVSLCASKPSKAKTPFFVVNLSAALYVT